MNEVMTLDVPQSVYQLGDIGVVGEGATHFDKGEEVTIIDFSKMWWGRTSAAMTPGLYHNDAYIRVRNGAGKEAVVNSVYLNLHNNLNGERQAAQNSWVEAMKRKGVFGWGRILSRRHFISPLPEIGFWENDTVLLGGRYRITVITYEYIVKETDQSRFAIRYRPVDQNGADTGCEQMASLRSFHGAPIEMGRIYQLYNNPSELDGLPMEDQIATHMLAVWYDEVPNPADDFLYRYEALSDALSVVLMGWGDVIIDSSTRKLYDPVRDAQIGIRPAVARFTDTDFGARARDWMLGNYGKVREAKPRMQLNMSTDDQATLDPGFGHRRLLN